jgi:hypothetical protein
MKRGWRLAVRPLERPTIHGISELRWAGPRLLGAWGESGFWTKRYRFLVEMTVSRLPQGGQEVAGAAGRRVPSS